MDWENDGNTEEKGEVQTLTRPSTRTQKPSMYKVLLLNDDYTPMDFVVNILKKFFRKDDQQATKIMLQVHNKGSGLAGVFTFEVAETKVFQVNNFSRQNKHPLKCVMEKDSPPEEDKDA